MSTITTTEMQRDYIKEYSPSLGREMELLHFGHSGRPLLVFPTSMGRFYQWEDFGLVGALADVIESGRVQLVCVDSVDGESWYARHRPSAERVRRHLQHQAYLGPLRAQDPKVIATGEQDPNVEDSIKLARLLAERGVHVGLEIWPGWAHDWPYWKDMMRRYIS